MDKKIYNQKYYIKKKDDILLKKKNIMKITKI